MARGAQLVYEPERPLRVRPGDDQRIALELAQPLRQHVRRDPGHLFLKLPEPPRTVEQRRDEQQCPPVPDSRKGIG